MDKLSVRIKEVSYSRRCGRKCRSGRRTHPYLLWGEDSRRFENGKHGRLVRVLLFPLCRVSRSLSPAVCDNVPTCLSAGVVVADARSP
jgi:hypothetical protein